MSEPVNPSITPLDFSFSIVTNYIIFPIDIRDVREVLARNGYELVPLGSPLPRRPLRIGLGGPIARKNEFVFYIDTDVKSVGLGGKSSERITEAFDELIEVLKKETNVDMTANTLYYEAIGRYYIRTQRKSIEQFSLLSEKIDLLKKTEELLKVPVSIFGVRLVPRNTIPNQVEWFDISIEPEVLQPDRYSCGIVFRSKERKLAFDWATHDKKILTQLIEVIESE